MHLILSEKRVYIDELLGVLCGLFHYTAKKEIINILSSFEGTIFGNKNLQRTTMKFVPIPQMVQHVILI